MRHYIMTAKRRAWHCDAESTGQNQLIRVRRYVRDDTYVD